MIWVTDNIATCQGAQRILLFSRSLVCCCSATQRDVHSFSTRPSQICGLSYTRIALTEDLGLSTRTVGTEAVVGAIVNAPPSNRCLDLIAQINQQYASPY